MMGLTPVTQVRPVALRLTYEYCPDTGFNLYQLTLDFGYQRELCGPEAHSCLRSDLEGRMMDDDWVI